MAFLQTLKKPTTKKVVKKQVEKKVATKLKSDKHIVPSGTVHVHTSAKEHYLLNEKSAAKVDSLGLYTNQLEALKGQMVILTKQIAELSGELITFAEEQGLPPSSTIQLQGEKFVASVGKKAEVSTPAEGMTIYEALESVEYGLGQKLMKFSIGDLKAYLPKNLFDNVVSTSFSGKRKVTVKPVK